MKTRILIKEGEYRLSRAGCMDAKLDAEELYCFMTGYDRVGIFLRADEDVDTDTENQYMDLIARRAERIPLQHITGVQEFMGYRFKVTPDVLVPRQDTEILVSEAASVIRQVRREAPTFFGRIRGNREWSVLDLCCGSGAIGLSLAKICDNAEVTLTDLSEAALKVAEENAKSLRVNAKFLQGDMFEPVGDKKFDMIVTNPPYIRTNMIAMLQEEVKDHEPMMALDGGRDGLNYYRTIIAEAERHLKPEGYLLMEIGYDQGEVLRKMLKDSGVFGPAEVLKDLPGRDRVVKCSIKKR